MPAFSFEIFTTFKSQSTCFKCRINSSLMENRQLLGNNTEQPLVNILWTGGFNSSYRVVQLSKSKVTIQPYYVSDNRRSERNELKAIADVTADIESHPDTKCTILPLIVIHVDNIEPDKTITEAYKRLFETSLIGTQYDWLSRLAKTIQGLEICIEKSENSKAHNCINKNGYVKKINEGIITYCVIDTQNSSADLIKVFGVFHFPLPLFDKTKLEILEEYKILGFKETINKTWFCHQPINNEPCGMCNPCKSVIEEGLSFRLTPRGLKRYMIERRLGSFKWYRLIKKTWLKLMQSGKNQACSLLFLS